MDGDKPFQCTKCDQCFANSDHLSVHIAKQHLNVLIPGLKVDSLADQTPTPTRFLKTCEDNQQLFEDINPFDQSFKRAAFGGLSRFESRTDSLTHNSDAEGNGNGCIAVAELSGDQAPVLSEATGVDCGAELCDGAKAGECRVESDFGNLSSSTNSVDESAAWSVYQAQPSPTPASIQAADTARTTRATSSQSSKHAPSLQTLISQLRAQFDKQESQPQQDRSQENEAALKAKQENLRAQLKALVQSGHIKLQLVQGQSTQQIRVEVASTLPSTSGTSVVSHPSPRLAPSSSTLQPVTIQPRLASSMSVLAVPTPAIVSAPTMVHSDGLVGSNLSFAKQKLKAALTQTQTHGAGPASENNNAGSRSSGSPHHNKYRDIFLDSDSSGESADSSQGRKKARSTDEGNPDEKRRRFLERNRAAASRCRQKRKIWVNQLERKSEDLVQTNSQLQNEIGVLRAEVAQLKALLLAHKDCPVTLQQKALMGQLPPGAYVTVSDGQIIAIHPVSSGVATALVSGHPTQAEELASTALTDMAASQLINAFAEDVSSASPSAR